MANFGFISKKKVAREIAKLNNMHSESHHNEAEFYFNMGVCNGMNALCESLKIKPMYRNKLGGGTGEMLQNDAGRVRGEGMSKTILSKHITAESGLAKGCLICGESVVVKDLFRLNEPVICDKCKAAVMKVREKMEGTAE